MLTIMTSLGYPLRFNIIEAGAAALKDNEKDKPEGFHALLSSFPGSAIHAFEIDPEVCAQMNAAAPPGLRYHVCALGRREEERDFYETAHPMCASLYRPNAPFLSLFWNLEVAREKQKTRVQTVSLDYFTRTQKTGPIDFIKIDIQGAELDVFEGGTETLKDVLLIVTEVEFVPLYENQPLFGDVCAFLHRQGLIFHKFVGLARRGLKEMLINGQPHKTGQHLWADALFVRDLLQLQRLSDEQLLKLAVLLNSYVCFDAAHLLFSVFDQRKGTKFAPRYANDINLIAQAVRQKAGQA